MHHSTEVSQDCHLYNLDYEVDQPQKDCSHRDAISPPVPHTSWTVMHGQQFCSGYC